MNLGTIEERTTSDVANDINSTNNSTTDYRIKYKVGFSDCGEDGNCTVWINLSGIWVDVTDSLKKRFEGVARSVTPP